MAGFVPVDPPRLAIASDGTLAAVHEASRITIVELPGGGAFAEVGMDPDAAESEVGWVGSPPRLVVLSRFASHSTLYLLDPHGPRTIAEIRLEAAMRLYATVGPYALAVGGGNSAVLTATDTQLTPYQFPARAMPVAAGAAGNQFVVALAAAVEEWDPQSRLPKRRLKLPRAATITAIGGSERVLWLTTEQEPARVDAIALVNRGQPKAHDLPEPIRQVAGHPRSDYVACIGAETGQLHVLDLDGRARRRVLACDGLDRLDAAAIVVGRLTGLLVAQAGKPIALVPLDGPEPRAATPPPRDHDAPEPPTTVSTLSAPPPDDVREPPTLTAIAVPASATWRDELVAWARAVAGGAVVRAAPAAPAVDALAARLELAELAEAIALVYGLHLGGVHGAAPIDIARVLGGWDEALGRGRLAGVVRLEASRLVAPAICRVLDELPPSTGTLVGAPGAIALLGPCVVVAPPGPLAPVAERCLASAGGAILAGAHDVEPAALFAEARAYGAAPMLRTVEPVSEPAILVVADDELADQLGLPRLA